MTVPLSAQFLEFLDLIKSLFHHAIRYESMHMGDQNIFIVRTVENADLPFGRCFLMYAPQKIMIQLFR